MHRMQQQQHNWGCLRWNDEREPEMYAQNQNPWSPTPLANYKLNERKKHKRATATLFALFYLTHIPGVRSQERNAEVILAYFTFNYKSLAMQQQNSKERKTNIHNIHLTIDQNHTTKESYEHEFYYTKKKQIFTERERERNGNPERIISLAKGAEQKQNSHKKNIFF